MPKIDPFIAIYCMLTSLRAELRDEIAGLRGELRGQSGDMGERMARQAGMPVAVVELPTPPRADSAASDP